MPSGFADGIDNVGSSPPGTIGKCNNATRNSCISGTANDGVYSDTTTEYRWRCDGQNGGSNSGICRKAKPRRFVSETVQGNYLSKSSCSEGWKHKNLNCRSGFSAVSCTSSYYGGAHYTNPNDGDEHKCEVKSNYCRIACRENACDWCSLDKCECGVQGSCVCEGYVYG